MSPTILFCPRCQATNPADANKCNACGVELPIVRTPSTSMKSGLAVNDVLQNGRYVIEGFLGGGGMGRVYRVRDTRLENKRWAIKEMSIDHLLTTEEVSQGVEAFRREAAMLAHLSHRNLPKVIDNFEENSRQYLVMDLVEGQTLSSYLSSKHDQPLPVAKVLDWAVQVCDALSYLHRQQPPVIFRDVKPDNIMVDREGVVKLIDFGIARHFKTGKAKDTVAFGTPGYAPPEQWGKQQSDARSDVYALAATLHHMLTGRDPIQHSLFVFPPARQLNPAVPEGLSAALQKALSFNPDDRWATVEDFRQAISASAQTPSLSPPLSSPMTPRGAYPNARASGCAPFVRFVGLGRSGARWGRSLVFWMLRVLLRPIVWLLPFPGVIRGVGVAALTLGFMLLILNGVIRIPPLIPIWNWFSSKTGELVLLGSLAQVTGVSVVLVLQILFSILVLPIGGVLGYLFSAGPRINPPQMFIANEQCRGREHAITACKSAWYEVAGKRHREPTFVVLCGKPGVGKSTVLKRFFLDIESDLEKALKVDGARPRELPYHQLLWIDCSVDALGVEQLVKTFPAALRAYYRVESRENILANACARYLQNVNMAIFIDQLDISNPLVSLGFWGLFLRSLAKRRPSRLSIWITANDSNCDYFRELGQQRFNLITINPLTQRDVAAIVSDVTGETRNASLQWVRANWERCNGDIKRLRDEAVKKNTA